MKTFTDAAGRTWSLTLTLMSRSDRPDDQSVRAAVEQAGFKLKSSRDH